MSSAELRRMSSGALMCSISFWYGWSVLTVITELARSSGSGRRLFSLLATVDVQRGGDGVNRFGDAAVVHVHSPALLGEQPARFELLEMVGNGRLGQLHDRSQVAGAGLLAGLIQDVSKQLEARRISKGLQANRQCDRVVEVEGRTRTQGRAADRRHVH